MDFPKSVPSVGLVNGKFVDEDPLLGTPGSLIPSAWGNAITQEVLNVILTAGLVPDEGVYTQLREAIYKIEQAALSTFGDDTGTANTYTAAYVPVITSVFNGMVLRFKAKNNNTGDSTFRQAGGVAKQILGLGLQPLQGGEIVADGNCTVVLSAVLDKWILISSTGGALQVSPATKSRHAMQLGQAVGRLIGVQTFSISGTYTPTAGTTSIIVEVNGGGGAGGGAPATGAGVASAGAGGAGGAYGRSRLSSGFSGLTVTVGAGGVPVSGAAGGAGGASSFGSLISAPGGPGGAVISGASSCLGGGGSAIATGGNLLNAAGGPAGAATIVSVGAAIGGAGGSSIFGGGGRISSVGLAGIAASSPGAGGAGTAQNASSAALLGGAGAPGLVIIYEYA